MAIIEIGSTPAEEHCAQVGSKRYDYAELGRLECRAYIVALRKVYGEPPEGASLFTKSNAHDYGTYYEVTVRFDDQPAAIEYATKVENGLSSWEEADMWPPVTYDDRGDPVNILRNPLSWNRKMNPTCRDIIEDESST